MDVNFTRWTLKEVLEAIPFDTSRSKACHLNFSKMAVPFYIKNGFRVSILYQDNLPYEACCIIYWPKRVVTIVIIMRKEYEDALRKWQKTRNDALLDECCWRRELYCHEACHLVAITRAFPSDRTSMAREDFKNKIKRKFSKSVASVEERVSVSVSMEMPASSPSVFEGEHFRYDNDELNYFRFYQELMIDYERMSAAVEAFCATSKNSINSQDVSRETHVPKQFFTVFPEKLIALQELLTEKMRRKDS